MPNETVFITLVQGIISNGFVFVLSNLLTDQQSFDLKNFKNFKEHFIELNTF